jgi:hypothetical protein
MVKVREVKHSDSDVSDGDDQPQQEGSGSSYDSQMDDESMEDELLERLNPFEDMAEEGEAEMDDYDGEDGESE